MDTEARIIGGAVVGGWVAALLALEALFPLRKRTRRFGPRFGVNLVVTALGFGVAAFTVTPAVTALVKWTSSRRFGLLYLVGMPDSLRMVLGIVLLDFTFYYWHRATHEAPLLWRFHNVHHIDPDMDVSTSFRFHFVEIVLSATFRALQVLLLGVGFLTVVVFQVLFMCATLFHHSNVRIPIRLERLLNKVIVTPRMHGIHHSDYRDETDSNYATIFRWWDCLNRTLRLNVPQQDVEIGVPAYQEFADNRLWSLIKLPFVRQRDYWRRRDSRRLKRDGESGEPKRMRE